MTVAMIMSLMKVAGFGPEDIAAWGIKFVAGLAQRGYDADTVQLDAILQDARMRKLLAEHDAGLK